MSDPSPLRRYRPGLRAWMSVALAGLIVVPIISGPEWSGASSASASDRRGSERPSVAGGVGDAELAMGPIRMGVRVTPTPAEPTPAARPGEERPTRMRTPGSRLRVPDPRTASPSDDVSTALVARVGELQVRQVAADPVDVGFHEAANPRALPMRPYGRLLANRNATRYEPTADTAEGGPYAVLHSRGRAAHPTSAVDVVMRDDDPVLAPVSGRVLDVRSIAIEGGHPDLRIEIQPDGDPDLRVVVIHVDGVRVRAGDQVVAGETRLADTARRFPFFSQIDELTAPDRWPHIHLEVQVVPPPEPAEAPADDASAEVG